LSVGFLLTFSPRNEAGQAPLGQFFAFKCHENTRITNFEKVERIHAPEEHYVNRIEIQKSPPELQRSEMKFYRI
jgi:hypothetical protein